MGGRWGAPLLTRVPVWGCVQLDEKKHGEEVAFLKRTNQQLKQQLESILAPASAAPAAKK
jgi:hypothetical protein